jgi:4-hydroxy-tetrahydrodipicolinate reductase
MESFARGLLPHLDRSAEPPPAVSERIARGGVYDWSRRDADLLRAARTEELFRWLAVDSSSRDSQSEIDTVHPARTAGVKAIVYGVGAMGSIMARLMLEKGVEIVGAIAQSPEKVGRDLGDVAQLGFKTGVTVESDARAALAERGADIAVVALGSHLHAMYPHFERCLEHGVNVVTIEEESFYPWFSAPALAAKLDRIGKEHGATITGSGQQDIYWMSMVSLLMGAAHRVDRVEGRTTWNADDYGPTVAREVHLDETPEEFEAFLAEQGWTSFVVQNTLDALVADLGLTKMHSTSSVVAVVAEADTFSRNLGRPILAGRMLGVIDSARVETERGTTLTFAMEGRVYGAGEVDVNEWVVRGEPEALRLFNDRVPTRMTTCTQVVNRIPDVINAPPGFVTVDMLPRLAYRPHRLDHYVS